MAVKDSAMALKSAEGSGQDARGKVGASVPSDRALETLCAVAQEVALKARGYRLRPYKATD
jgi:hypothetical protein